MGHGAEPTSRGFCQTFCRSHLDFAASLRALRRDVVRGVRRLLIPAAALLWGLQFAFLSPALALLLVELFGATATQVGWVLAVYNASGFVASLVMPAYADRKRD